MSAHLQDELLAAALDGTLTASDRDAVEAHLEVCERCRGELEVARGARDALRELPSEVRPPVDLAAAVASELSAADRAAPTGPAATSGSPRWYRAAGLVAAAAAIVLAIVILPNLGDRASEDRSATEAVGAGGGAESAPAASATAPVNATAGGQHEGKGVIGTVTTDFDAGSLQALADEGGAPATFASAAQDMRAEAVAALDCIRAAAGDALPPDAPDVRLLVATYEGTRAYLGVFSLADGRAQVWVAARDDCRLLASATSAG